MDATNIINAKKVDLDNVLDQFGVFQQYHIERILLLMVGLFFNGMYSMNFVFATEEVPYRCKDGFEGDYCKPSNSSLTCSEWVYDNPDSFFAYVSKFLCFSTWICTCPFCTTLTKWQNTRLHTPLKTLWITLKLAAFCTISFTVKTNVFQLACQEWKRTLVGTMHSIGYMCGLLLTGPMSDRFGRKPIAVITGVLGAVFGILKSFSPWYWFYISMEFLEGAIGDNCSPLFVLTLEITSTKKKIFAFMFGSLGMIVGGISLATVAWLTPDWRWFLRAIYIPAFAFVSYKCFLDESPRWLLTKGRKEKALTILKNAAKRNKFDIDKNSLENLSHEVNKKVTYVECLKETFNSKKLRRRFFVCLIWWTTSTFVHFGLMINAVSLEGNKYFNYILVALADLPGSLIVIYILIYFKRKVPLMLAFFAGAALCIAQPFLPTNLPWLSILFYMAGKLMCLFYFYITYVYTAELFPTYTRNSMHALCSSIGRVGAIVAPQTPFLTVYWPGLPSFVFGLAALVAGLSTFLVPDIADDALPDTVHQAEALGRPKIPSKAVGSRDP